MGHRLYSGIPKESDYRKLVTSRMYLDMDEFSAQFLEENIHVLSGYSSKWVANPIRQWSRKWEYPYVFERISSLIEQKDSATILDAGSGISFFPFYVLSKYPNADVHCVDYDPVLVDVYSSINQKSGQKVTFRKSDLRSLTYPSGMFDLIYSVSVLEHTNSYSEIIKGFYDLLAPGGILAVTFDLSLDGKRNVSIEKARDLLGSLTSILGENDEPSPEIDIAPESLTTLIARDIDPDCLPWKAPAWSYRVDSLLKGKGLVSWPPPLTVYCLSLTKKEKE